MSPTWQAATLIPPEFEILENKESNENKDNTNSNSNENQDIPTEQSKNENVNSTTTGDFKYLNFAEMLYDALISLGNNADLTTLYDYALAHSTELHQKCIPFLLFMFLFII